MVSTRSYLIRAIYEWAQDNGLTPHILVDATQNDVSVPSEFIEDGKIILNIANGAVTNLSLGDDLISFNARFSGIAREIFVPTSAVQAVYARENGIGIVLPEDSQQAAPPPDDDPPVAPRRPKGPKLKVIK